MELKRPEIIVGGKPMGWAMGTVVKGAGGFVFLMGFTGYDYQTGATPLGLGPQVKAAWKGIIKALEENGTSAANICHAWTHVVGTFPHGIRNDPRSAEIGKARREAWDEHYGAEFVEKNLVAGTLVGCTALSRPEVLVEITVIAAIP